MSETRIMDIIELVDKSSRIIMNVLFSVVLLNINVLAYLLIYLLTYLLKYLLTYLLT